MKIDLFCTRLTEAFTKIDLSYTRLDQGHKFVVVNCADFRGTVTAQKPTFRGNFAVNMLNFAAISRRILKISR